MKRNGIKSECNFIGLKNNRLHYRCKECKKICYKSINGEIKKFPREIINFAMAIIINLFCY